MPTDGIKRRYVWQPLAMMPALYAVACGDDLVTYPKGPNLHVSPPSASIVVADSVRFTATTVGIADRRVVWTSSLPAVATVDSSGLVRALAPGRAMVMVRSVASPSLRSAGTVNVRSP